MRRSLGIVLGAALLVARLGAGLPQTAPTLPQPTGTAAISGVVSDAATGKPIVGASVALFITQQPGVPGRPPTRPSMLTDARGRFVFLDLPATLRYRLAASHPRYGSASYKGGVSIVLTDGQWLKDANISMSVWRAPSIGGRVVDERGEPVVGAAVRLFSRRLLAGHERLIQGPVATTDDRGVYRFAAREGRYFVAVLSVQATVPASTADGARTLALGGLEGRLPYTPPGSPPETHGASIDVDGRHRLVLTNFATPPPPGTGRARAYAPVFYPNARTVDDAQAIDAGAGASRGDVDFQLVPVATARVSGRVTGAVQGAANMLLRLMAPGAEHLGFGNEVATTLVEADGHFTFLNVPAGIYTLMASPAVAEIGGALPKAVGYGPAQGLSAMYPGNTNFMWWQAEAGASVWGRMPVSVGEADVTGLEVPLQTAATVRGRVVFDDQVPPDPSQRFPVGLEPANGDPSLGAPDAYTAAGDASHGFTIGGLQGGRYFFRLESIARLFGGGWRVESITARGVDLTEAGFDGALGRDFDDVVVTVTKTGADLSGFVRDAQGQPASGAAILFPVDPKQWVDYGLTPDRLRSTSVGADGAYKFTTLPNGEYYVVAVPSGQSDGWLDPRFLSAAVARAAKVRLTLGASSNQDLRLSEVVVK